MPKPNNNYDADSIKVLEGLEPVRKRPGMYIGSTDTTGLHHLVWEIVDNSIDEVLAGEATWIEVTIKADGSMIIEDNGRGIPVGMHQTGKSALEVIFTTLHAGGKFSEEGGAYKVSGGLHGVGASIVNALSTKLVVDVFHNKKQYRAIFENGGKTTFTTKAIGSSNKRGTRVQFWPDPTIFSDTNFKASVISERLRESAFLLNNLEIRVIDEKNENKTEIFHYEKGLIEFVDFIAAGKKSLSTPYSFEGNREGIEIAVAFQYVHGYSEVLLSFVNNIKTLDGGSHVIGLKASWTKVLNDYARSKGLLKDKDKNLEGDDYREGLICIISVRVPEKILEFVGQTKDKLGTPIARLVVEDIVNDKLGFWLESNPSQSLNIIQKAIDASQARMASKKARDDARKLKGLKHNRQLLSGKLSPAQSRNPKINELFLVEGDSAGGSAKLGRDRKFQAILPLRGKVINAEKSKLVDVLKNEEILSIISAIGADIGEEFNVNECNYDKIIIMTDADTDGAHIQALLITFFFRYMKQLFKSQKIYVALPPLYKIQKNSSNEYVYAWDENELKLKLQNYGKNTTIQRYKGLGEMNASQLWETTMDPKTRTLIQVLINDEALAERRVSILMGDDVEARRKWIEENVEFTLIDKEYTTLGEVNNGENQNI